MVDKQSKQIICIAFDKGRKHDFNVYKRSKLKMKPTTKCEADTGYQGIAKFHSNSEIPKKKSKKNPLSKADKKQNHILSSSRVVIENVIREVKIFKLMAEKYRNRRKRFTLRLNLITAIINFEL